MCLGACMVRVSRHGWILVHCWSVKLGGEGTVLCIPMHTGVLVSLTITPFLSPFLFPAHTLSPLLIFPVHAHGVGACLHLGRSCWALARGPRGSVCSP